jgi:hypothetical protein
MVPFSICFHWPSLLRLCCNILVRADIHVRLNVYLPALIFWTDCWVLYVTVQGLVHTKTK